MRHRKMMVRDATSLYKAASSPQPRSDHFDHSFRPAIFIMLIKRKSIEAQANSKEGPARRRKPKYAPVTLSELDGVRYLHFGTEWVQGAMRIRKPQWIELEYAQQMMAWLLFLPQQGHVAQLGLGTAALTKFCHHQFPELNVTAVELNPAVVAVCREFFKLPPPDERLNIFEMDALDFVNDPANHGTLDALQIDLYDATARGPVLDSVEFYQACSDCMQQNGVLTVNLFGDHPSFLRNMKSLRKIFKQVLCLPEVHDGNVVALAFNTPVKLDFPTLYARAEQIHSLCKLPAKSWVNGLKAELNA